ncbi:MAG: hypothetical protein MUE41_07420 [Gemmatimonadaceae bacterium]|jgi:hypothetical protein|nr:hypothetical protein [Gemmatimonadaceae bacterium]
MPRRIGTFALALLLSACAHTTAIDRADAPVGNGVLVTGLVEITTAADTVTIRNGAAHPVAIRLIEFETSTRVRLAPCTPDSCAVVRAGDRGRVAVRDALGWSAEARQLLVHVWSLTPQKNGALVADRLETVLLPLTR